MIDLCDQGGDKMEVPHPSIVLQEQGGCLGVQPVQLTTQSPARRRLCTGLMLCCCPPESLHNF